MWLVFFDRAAVVHDLALFPQSQVNPRGHPRFDGSAAQRFLKKDLDDEVDEGIAPKALWNTRPEYKMFPLKVFRGHLDKERGRRRQKSYWLNQGKRGAGSRDNGQ
jgi:hypothetical protein